VTAITATYNWATVLPYAIASVLDQTFTDFELLVIGDGCTDESEQIVDAIADPRVRWYNLPTNVGHQSGPNNEGLRQARGDVIAYLGHDDLWLPHHLEALVAAVDEGARLVHGISLDVSVTTPPVGIPWPGWVYVPGTWIPPTAVMHDRALIDEVGSWKHPRDTGTLDPEGELWARMADVSGPPRLVSRITNVKLPASKRRGVYRTRPFHEQAYWLQRIREADDPEASLRAACNERYVHAQRRRLRLRRSGTTLATADQRRRRVRRFKGLDE
jgi:glycosyltransferase involved in cell wall biosynthesis